MKIGLVRKRWDIFCRVIDNFGDIGVCWRLARQLATEHEAKVRLWVDNLQTFASLCPSNSMNTPRQIVGPIEVCLWQPDFPIVEPADVVIEAFACELPESYVASMAQCTTPPVWINLEYLSAEDWVDTCHLGRSPHPKVPLIKYFFFPGFPPNTGGLLREHELIPARARFDSEAQDTFWERLRLPPSNVEELRVSMFCYDNPALFHLLDCWANGTNPIRLLATAGAATRQIADFFQKKLSPGDSFQVGPVTVNALPFLLQDDYDCLLWSCDMNFVRGEDSFVRAQWAQRPYVWQIYPQAQDAHLAKLDAFLAKYLDTASPEIRDVVRQFWFAWNGEGDVAAIWPKIIASRQLITEHAVAWVHHLDRIPHLVDNLTRFVQEK